MQKVLPMEASTSGELKMIGIPVKFSHTKAAIRTAPPMLGQHNREVLNELGIEDQLETLVDEGVV